MGGDQGNPEPSASEQSRSHPNSTTSSPGFPAFWGVLKRALSESIDDNVPRLGASLAFYTLLSLAPVVVIIVAMAALAYGQRAAQGQLVWQIGDLVGPAGARTVQAVIEGAYTPGTGVIATLAGVLTLAYGASSVFVELHDALNVIWHVSPHRHRTTAATVIRLIADRFYSFAMVLGAGFLLLVSLVLNVWIAAVGIALPRIVIFVFSFLLIATLFAALYRSVPDVSLAWGDVALAAALTSLLFLVGKHFIGLYFTQAGFRSTYGAAGSPLVLLLWVYYSAQLFLWGAEFSKLYTKIWGSQSER